MKRLFFYIAMALCVFALFACGQTDTPTDMSLPDGGSTDIQSGGEDIRGEQSSVDSGSSTDKKPPHKHVYDTYEITVEPTCDTEGERKAICSCGKEITETLNLKGHAYKVTKVDPTCGTDGYVLYECDCGKSYTAGTATKLGHDYDYETAICVRCGGEMEPTNGLTYYLSEEN